MLMEMPVPIHVVEDESGFAKQGELSADFRLHLFPNAMRKGDPGSDTPGRTMKNAFFALSEEIRDPGTIERRGTVDQGQMQANAKLGHSSSPPDGVGGGLSRDHEAGAGEDTVPVRHLDGLVDGKRHAEIVCRQNDLARAGHPNTPFE